MDRCAERAAGGGAGGLDHHRAVRTQAELNLGYTVLQAPVDGVVGSRTVRAGLYVQPGTLLLAVVPLQATYVLANYKETRAGRRPAQATGQHRCGHVRRRLGARRGDSIARPAARSRPAAARQCDRQLHQDRPAHPGQDQHRPERSARRPPASGHVSHRNDQGGAAEDAGGHRRCRGRGDGEPRIDRRPAREGASLRAWIPGSAHAGRTDRRARHPDHQLVASEIEGGIGTGIADGTWISTSYLIGEIIMIPLTDYLSRVFSFRRFLLGNLVLFWCSRLAALAANPPR